MLGLRPGELLFIGIILVAVFSAARMGQLGNAIGRFVYSFKKAARGGDLVDARPLPRARRGQDVSDADYQQDSRPKRG
jgi:sec-independent protein translocase protein TatA